jgi:hypothetical protein
MALAQKKVIVREFEGGLTWGYLPAAGFVEARELVMMEVDGRAKRIPMAEVKFVCFVRDFNRDDAADPERMGRRTFQRRPRGDGIWIKLTLRDGDALEGLANMDLLQLDALVDDGGLFLTPPELKSNVLRVFVPRSAMAEMEVLGMVTAPSKRVAARKVVEEAQVGLFGE